MLTQNQAVNKIKKVYDKKYEQYDEIVEWLINEETETEYRWRFSLPSYNVTISCDKITGEVTVK